MCKQTKKCRPYSLCQVGGKAVLWERTWFAYGRPQVQLLTVKQRLARVATATSGPQSTTKRATMTQRSSLVLRCLIKRCRTRKASEEATERVLITHVCVRRGTHWLRRKETEKLLALSASFGINLEAVPCLLFLA